MNGSKISCESHLSRHTSQSLKNIVKIWETRPQSSKNAEKLIKICKIHDVDKSTLLFRFNRFFVFNSENIKKVGTKPFWKSGHRFLKNKLNCALNLLWNKYFFDRLLKLAIKNFFIQSTFKAHLKKKLKKSETTFSIQFCPEFSFYVFFARLQNRTQKSYWKPNSSVRLSTSWILQIFIHFWTFLLLCGLVCNIFTMFFRDLEVCLEKCDSYGDFCYLTKNQTFNFEEKFVNKKIHCPSFVTLTLLLFI